MALLASEVQGCEMSYFDAYFAIGVVCMFWFIFVTFRDDSVLSDEPMIMTIATLCMSIFYPIWFMYRLAMWDKKNVKGRQ